MAAMAVCDKMVEAWPNRRDARDVNGFVNAEAMPNVQTSHAKAPKLARAVESKKT